MPRFLGLGPRPPCLPSSLSASAWLLPCCCPPCALCPPSYGEGARGVIFPLAFSRSCLSRESSEHIFCCSSLRLLGSVAKASAKHPNPLPWSSFTLHRTTWTPRSPLCACPFPADLLRPLGLVSARSSRLPGLSPFSATASTAVLLEPLSHLQLCDSYPFPLLNLGPCSLQYPLDSLWGCGLGAASRLISSPNPRLGTQEVTGEIPGGLQGAV